MPTSYAYLLNRLALFNHLYKMCRAEDLRTSVESNESGKTFSTIEKIEF